MKNKNFAALILFVIAMLCGLVFAFGQDSTTYTYTIKVPVKTVVKADTLYQTIIKTKTDTIYKERIVYVIDTPVIIKPEPVIDSIKISTYTGTFNHFLNYIANSNKVGVIDKNIIINEGVNVKFPFQLIGYNKPTITISNKYLFWLVDGEHIFNNINIDGTIITGNITLVNCSLNELRLLVSGKANIANSSIRYIGGGGLNNAFNITLDNSVVDALSITNINKDARIYLKNKSVYKPIFNWKPPTGLIIKK